MPETERKTLRLAYAVLVALMAIMRPVPASADIARGPLSLRGSGAWLVDESGALTLGEVSAMAFETVPRVDFGIGEATVWNRFDLVSDADRSWVLFTRLHKADRVDFYAVREDGRVETASAGSEVPLRDRQWRYRRPAFSFSAARSEAVTLYVSMRGRSHLYSDFYLSDDSAFFDYAFADETFLFFYFGAISVIALYNLFIFLITRDRDYLYYFLYVFFMLMYQFSVEGYGNLYLWPGCPWFMPRSYNMFIAADFTLAIAFTRSYLDLARNAPRLDRIGRALMVAFAAIGASFIVTTASWLVDIGTVFILLGAIYVLACAYYVLHRRYEPAAYYAAAWTALVAGLLVTTAKRLGWLPANRVTEYAFHGANLAEVVLLALALGDKVRFQAKKRLEAEEALIDANGRVLQNRMRPHFLFNSMNIIFNQLRESPEAAQATLGLLSDNYHYLTETDGKSLVALSDEWAFLENYLALMERRWPGALELRLSFEPCLERLPVPPLILQPLAENAFKYGLRALERKRLTASARLEGRLVVLSVANPSDRPLGPVDYGRTLGNILGRVRRYYPDASVSVAEEGGEVVSELRFAFPGGGVA